ncbi:MAG: HAMP domain-containing protein [Candidatus Obscuribacterales bacterium]|nr:HAMP domain-containing protein [Candidatus Obscuribacterales bacterium]
MKLNIVYKLVVLVLLVTALAVGLIAGFTRYSISAGFSKYVARAELSRIDSLAPVLEWEYAKRNGWERLIQDPNAMWWLIAFNEGRNGRPTPINDRAPADAGDGQPRERRPGPGEGEMPPDMSPYFEPGDRLQYSAPPEGAPRRLPPDATPPVIPSASSSDVRSSLDFASGSRRFAANSPDSNGGMPRYPEQRLPPPFPPVRMEVFRRVGLFDANRKLVWGDSAASKANQEIVLKRGSRTIGYLRLAPHERLTAAMERDFVDDQNRNILGVCIIAFSFAALAGLLMSQNLVSAINILVQGTRQLNAGNYKTRINLMRTDELGQLAHDFNCLADTLDEHDRAQRQWIADTSHELRTPIAVLRAQVEALQDGVQEAGPRTLGVLHGEIMTLSKLVDDLYLLAKSDVGKLRYDFVPVDLTALVLDIVEGFDERFDSKNMDVELKGFDRPVIINADASRLRQLFYNLFENSVRYTDADGKLTVTMSDEGAFAVIWIDDSPPGITDENLARIFDRFFRGEMSRSRDFGGAGLGLAICRTIVDGHEGTIGASHSPAGGLRIELKFPLSQGRTNG